MNLQRIVKIGLTLVGLALLIIGGAKILHFESFVDALDGYQVFPEVCLEPVAALIVGVEIALALGLCIPRFQRMSALGLIGLLLVFTIAVGSSLLNGLSIDCGCFGNLTGPTKLSWLMVERNLAIVSGLCLVLFWTSPNRKEWNLWKIKSSLVTHYRTLFGAALMTVMAVSMIWLIQNNRILVLKLEMFDPSPSLKAGDMAPPLMVKTIGGGEEKEISFSGDRKTVLLIFSPTCPHCQDAIRWWNMRLASTNLESNPPSVIGISVDPAITGEFIKNFQVSFPVYVPSSIRKFKKTYKAHRVPWTLFIDPGGKISYTFLGPTPQNMAIPGMMPQ